MRACYLSVTNFRLLVKEYSPEPLVSGDQPSAHMFRETFLAYRYLFQIVFRSRVLLPGLEFSSLDMWFPLRTGKLPGLFHVTPPNY